MNLNRVIIYSLAAAFFWAIVKFEIVAELHRGFWHWFCVACALILSAAAFVLGADWLVNVAVSHQERITQIAAISPVTEMLKSLTLLSPSTAHEIAVKLNITGENMTILPGDNGAVLQWKYTTASGKNGAIDYSFIEAFIEDGSDSFLPAYRDYGTDGSTVRKHARLLTNHMIKNGYAKPASGSNPAKWEWEMKDNEYYSRRWDALMSFTPSAFIEYDKE